MSEDIANVTDAEPIGSPEVSGEVIGQEPDSPILPVEEYST
jgi:hypothetical protein